MKRYATRVPSVRGDVARKMDTVESIHLPRHPSRHRTPQSLRPPCNTSGRRLRPLGSRAPQCGFQLGPPLTQSAPHQTVRRAVSHGAPRRRTRRRMMTQREKKKKKKRKTTPPKNRCYLSLSRALGDECRCVLLDAAARRSGRLSDAAHSLVPVAARNMHVTATERETRCFRARMTPFFFSSSTAPVVITYSPVTACRASVLGPMDHVHSGRVSEITGGSALTTVARAHERHGRSIRELAREAARRTIATGGGETAR